MSVKKVRINTHMPQISELNLLTGFNMHSVRRVEDSRQFLNEYTRNKVDFFSKQIFKKTQYYKSINSEIVDLNSHKEKNIVFNKLRRSKINTLSKEKCIRFINLYEQLSIQNSFEDLSEVVPYHALPFAIRFPSGFTLERDGAHRRSIASFLGHKSILTLELDVRLIDTSIYSKYNFKNWDYKFFETYLKYLS
ncbi:hypothetical protein OAH81_03650 [Candidatus Pseudothioglobus singularis]|nr:hypothetical protein [Candidatus Pseudothioglobus singularis]